MCNVFIIKEKAPYTHKIFMIDTIYCLLFCVICTTIVFTFVFSDYHFDMFSLRKFVCYSIQVSESERQRADEPFSIGRARVGTEENARAKDLSTLFSN